MTTITARTRLYAQNIAKSPRTRVQRQHQKGTGLRLGNGEIWDQGDAMDLLDQGGRYGTLGGIDKKPSSRASLGRRHANGSALWKMT